MQIHAFTPEILKVLAKNFGESCAAQILHESPLLGYLNTKTKSASRGAKSRGSFANHYALYVVIEDYIKGGFYGKESEVPYSKYDGARFSELFARQRQLPFGAKLQNHALNSRLNDEFRKYYPDLGIVPIVRDLETQRYWIQEDLLSVEIRLGDGTDSVCNIAQAIIEIIDRYVEVKMAAFEGFIDTCRQIAELGDKDPEQATEFVKGQLQPNVDARVFEIVSYAVLKARYELQSVWLGETQETVEEEPLILYKTGRTNANDGGIDFVMKPLGRFFQVTETVDAGKYFLDIDKVQRFPITFVVKSSDSAEVIKESIKRQAVSKYKVEAVVEAYMKCVEDVVNIPALLDSFEHVISSGRLMSVMNEIIVQSKVEFNYNEETSSDDDLDADFGIVVGMD
jgi:hypothetical protein